MRPFLEWELIVADAIGDQHTIDIMELQIGNVANLKKAEYPVTIDRFRKKFDL